MTCVVSSAWNPFSTPHGWSPMNPDDISHAGSGIDRPLYGYASSESESRPVPSGGGKKRASRAGTRSVTTLSAAQLERKRANDREAQRAIRQRTKDHIEALERNINDLRAANDASEKIATIAHQRSRELEEENTYLRTKLGEVGYPMAVPPDSQRPQDHSLLTVHSTSPAAQAIGASIPRPESTSTPRSTLSINTSHSSSSRHGSWQQPAPSTQYSVTAASAPASLPANSNVQIGSGLTTWRSHENVSSVQANPTGMQDHPSLPHQASYPNSVPADRQQWGVSSSYAYSEQRTPSVHQASPQPQQTQYVQTPMGGYATQSAPPQSSYVAPPQSEFQNMAVHSPPAYPGQQQQSYTQQPNYQMTPLQVQPAANSGEYVTQSHMHAPLMATAGYAAAPDNKTFSQSQMQQSMQYREASDGRSYSLTHYPSG